VTSAFQFFLTTQNTEALLGEEKGRTWEPYENQALLKSQMRLSGQHTGSCGC